MKGNETAFGLRVTVKAFGHSGRGGGAGSKFHVKVIVAKEECVWKEIKANVESSENISCQTFTGSIKITKSDFKNAVQFI